MGFERKRRLIELRDLPGTMEGLEIDVRGMTMREDLQLTEMMDNAKKLEEERAPARDQAEAVRSILAFLAGRIVRWNLTEDGVPVSPSVEELMEFATAEVFAVMDKWREAGGSQPSAPLERKSSAGAALAEVSIPMDAPSSLLPH